MQNVRRINQKVRRIIQKGKRINLNHKLSAIK